MFHWDVVLCGRRPFNKMGAERNFTSSKRIIGQIGYSRGSFFVGPAGSLAFWTVCPFPPECGEFCVKGCMLCSFLQIRKGKKTTHHN